MIINALAEAYDRLSSNSDIEISRDGYAFKSINYYVVIDDNGNFIDLVAGQATREKVPEQIKKTTICPLFLFDNFNYVFGLCEDTDNKGTLVESVSKKQERHFEYFKNKNINDLRDVESDIAKAIIKFLAKWVPSDNVTNELFFEKDKSGKRKLKNINGSIFMFALNDITKSAHKDSEILKKWELLRTSNTEDNVKGQCCISGKINVPIARIHNPIFGVKDAQTTGAAIVSYKSPAFESYNKSQSYNGPISEAIMKKYTAALNYFLLNGSKNKIIIGNDTIVFWAETDNEAYADEIWDYFGIKQDESSEEATENKVLAALKLIRNGQAPITDDDTRFHMLFLSPNAARISVRRYYNTTLGVFKHNVLQHYQDMMILDSKEELKQIPFWQITDATVSSAITKERTNSVNPDFSGSLFEAVLNNHPYPSALFAEMIARMKTDNTVSDDKLKASRLIDLTNIRAAFIKAYIVHKDRKENKKEEITLELNRENQNEGYLLGRLFAVMEKVQQDAIPGANSTIKDRFFASACSTPAAVFPSLLMGYQNHVAKLDVKGIRYEKLLDEIICKLSDSFPKQLDLDGQGRFILGYYQQRVDLWKKQNLTSKNENNQGGNL